MKKAIAILLSMTMILGLAACGNSASQTEQPPTEDTSVESKADTNSAENSTDMERTVSIRQIFSPICSLNRSLCFLILNRVQFLYLQSISP